MHKLHPKWFGLFVVMEKLGVVTYCLDLLMHLEAP